MSERRQLSRRWSCLGGRMWIEQPFSDSDWPPRAHSPGGLHIAHFDSTPWRDGLQVAAMRAIAFAIEHLLFPTLVALLLLYLFRNAAGGPSGYVDQINRWLGFDELTRAFERRW
jgi:hypothetical protein